MTTKDLHERLRGIQGCWDQALADLQEVSSGLEAIVRTPRENDLVAIAKHYGRDPKVFAIGMFDAVIMLKALTTVLEMTEPMFKKILPFTWSSIWRHMNVWHDLALGPRVIPVQHLPHCRELEGRVECNFHRPRQSRCELEPLAKREQQHS